ncbi:MAG: hypothetical protein E7329_05625 [Clostridiales bacterium]|nr:hypothetical protein [Clostridiales bacterium]
MTIHIHIRQLGKKRNTVSAVPFDLSAQPATVGELITAVVQECVAAYNQRVRRGEMAIHPMTEERLADMETVGKLAFGVNYSEKQADEATAIANALQGFEDGLYRIFQGQRELTGLDEGLSLSDKEELTFIRLTMLTGSIF